MVDLSKRLKRYTVSGRFPRLDWDGEDVLFAVILFLVFAFVLGLIWWGIWYGEHVDQVNQRFADRCHAQGGRAVITDKDLCIRKGLVIDWEH
jgi:hypothetical protein